MARRAILVVPSLLTISMLLILSASPATAGTTVAPTINDPVEAIYAWFPRHGVDPRVAVCVAKKESGLDARNDSRSYYGLFQQMKSAWPKRVAAYNQVNDLKTPNASPYDPTTQALVSAWMVKNDGHWGQWPSTGRQCGARTSRSRRR